jgi:hypothetical protein
MNRILTIIWIALLILATISFQIAHLGLINKIVMLLLAFITMLKGCLVVNYFMDLRNSYWVWKVSIFFYLFTVLAIIAIAYIKALT